MKRAILISAALLALAGCKEDQAALPAAVAITDEALGYYCQMALTEHDGPKAQVHLADAPAPLFFSQVRDGLAFQRSPEKSAEIVAIYVSDMSHAASWQDPGADNWVALEDAFLVVGSDAVGGMGASELVPFSRNEDALSFAAEHGGEVVRANDVPDSAVLGPADMIAGDDGNDDFARRLHAVQHNGDE